MNAGSAPDESANLSIVHGPSLASEKEQEMGAHTIGAYVREIARRHGDKEAVVLRRPDYRVSWTYNDLWDRSVEVAKALIAAGVVKDTRVGVLMTNRPEYLSAMFGIALAGGVTVSLSTFSTNVELEYLLKEGAPTILLYDRQVLKKDFGAALTELEPAILGAKRGELVSEKFPFLQRLVALDSVTDNPAPAKPDSPCVETWDTFLKSGAAVSDALVEARASTVTPSDTGIIFFSSGTTSLPKGIVHAQRGLPVQWWRWRRIFQIDPVNYPVRAWTGNGLFWSGNISMMVGLALTTGGAIIMQPLFNPDEALDLIGLEKITYANGRPHQWARLQESPNWAGADLSSLHYMTYDTILSSHPTVKTDWFQGPAFGTTETLTINTAVEAKTPLEEYQGSYGKPLPGNILKIFDPETGEIVKRGERGEMAIKGPTLMLRYIGKTVEECFDDDGFFCTGDGGYVDDRGYFFWEGRLTEGIKTGGANVSPIEIDLAIGMFPGVKRSMTVGVPDEMLGEKVVACIVAQDGVTLNPADITKYLKEQLASFKVPREILFFNDDEIDLTGSGKIKFKQLREIAVKRLAQ